jgi:hypothetical protein
MNKVGGVKTIDGNHPPPNVLTKEINPMDQRN